jgi:hypothetical protein
LYLSRYKYLPFPLDFAKSSPFPEDKSGLAPGSSTKSGFKLPELLLGSLNQSGYDAVCTLSLALIAREC